MAGDAETIPRRGPHRLFWLIDSLTMGGAEALVVPFGRAARDHGIELTVCARTTIGGNPLEKELRDAGVHVENLAARGLLDVTAMRRLSGLVRDLRPDILHAHLAYASIWGALVARRHHIPFVASLHVPPVSGGDLRESVRQRLMIALLNRYASRVVVVSESLRDEWSSRTSLDPAKISVIHNGIEMTEAPRQGDAIRRELGIGSDHPVVTTVAVLRPGKGIDILLEAAVRVIRTLPDAVFVVVGDGPMREQWRRLSDDLGIAASIRWTGFRRDVPAILDASDLFALPTLADAFPTVVLEAFAAGVPVVASDVGGIPEIVEDGLTGQLIPAGDPAALAEAITTVLQDDAWRTRAAGAARQRVERDFSTRAWFSRLDELYASVSDEERRGGEGRP